MNALLVLNNKNVTNCRIYVSLNEQNLVDTVVSLMKQSKEKEAFEILKTRSEIRRYIPTDKEMEIMPELTLFENEKTEEGGANDRLSSM